MLTLIRPRNMLRDVAMTLLSHGFAEMEVDPAMLTNNLEPLKDGLRRMTDDPELGKLFRQQIVYTDPVINWKMEAGLYRRDPKTGHKEAKWFLHDVSTAKWSTNRSVAQFADFLNASAAVRAWIKQLSLALAREIDKIHRERGLEVPSLFAAIHPALTVFRMLRYLELPDQVPSDVPDAHPHLDLSALSFQIWASVRGLVIVDKFGVAHYVEEVSIDRIAVFFGKKYAAIFAGTPAELTGYCKYGTGHGVKDGRRALRTRDSDRIAFVVFQHARLSPIAARWILQNDAEMDAFEKTFKL